MATAIVVTAKPAVAINSGSLNHRKCNELYIFSVTSGEERNRRMRWWDCFIDATGTAYTGHQQDMGNQTPSAVGDTDGGNIKSMFR